MQPRDCPPGAPQPLAMFNALTAIHLWGSGVGEAASVYPRLLLPLHLGGTWGLLLQFVTSSRWLNPELLPLEHFCCPAVRQMQLNAKTTSREAEGELSGVNLK